MSINDDQQDEIVQVPVPRRYLGVVYQALAEAMARDGSRTEPMVAVSSKEASEKKKYSTVPWSSADIRRLKRMNSYRTVTTIMNLASAEVGRLVPIKEVETVSDLPHTKVRGQLAGLTQLVKREFDRENWPFAIHWGTDGRANYYLDSEEVARAWREA